MVTGTKTRTQAAVRAGANAAGTAAAKKISGMPGVQAIRRASNVMAPLSDPACVMVLASLWDGERGHTEIRATWRNVGDADLAATIQKLDRQGYIEVEGRGDARSFELTELGRDLFGPLAGQLFGDAS